MAVKGVQDGVYRGEADISVAAGTYPQAVVEVRDGFWGRFWGHG